MRRKKIAAVLAALVLLFQVAGCAAKTGPSVSASSVTGTSSQKESNSALPHSLGLSGVKNARDLGGYRTADGKTVKMGLLLRTAALSDATADDIKILTGKYHLTQVIDFRTNKGIRKNPDPKMSGVTETNLPIHSGSGNLSYLNMVTDLDSISAFRQFFAILLAHKNGAVLFHCAAGKDRTGVASILLLSALNVDRNTILQDYLLSNKYYSSPSSQSECVKEAWAMTLFDTIDSKYGSMDNFLNRQLGLTSQNRAQLKASYLA